MGKTILQELNEVVSELESRKGFEREAESLHKVFIKLSGFSESPDYPMDTIDVGTCPECGEVMTVPQYSERNEIQTCGGCGYQGETKEELGENVVANRRRTKRLAQEEPFMNTVEMEGTEAFTGADQWELTYTNKKGETNVYVIQPKDEEEKAQVDRAKEGGHLFAALYVVSRNGEPIEDYRKFSLHPVQADPKSGKTSGVVSLKPLGLYRGERGRFKRHPGELF